MYHLISTLLILTVGIWADFNFSTCSGSGTFEQQIDFFDGDYERDTLVGTIPAGIKGLHIALQSDNDVDIRLMTQTGEKIVHWPYGLLRGAVYAEAPYQGVKVIYSGYNGTNGNKGDEYIEVNGTTPVPFIMRAFGCRAGYATVTYSWTGKEGCQESTEGEGNFTQQIAKDDVVLVGTIPPMIHNLNITLESTADLDIQLYGADGTIIVGWNPKGLLFGPALQDIDYHGMHIVWSGYNGVNGSKGNEFIKIEGATTEALVMKVYGYAAGEANVTYRWGSQQVDNNLTVDDINYTHQEKRSSLIGTNLSPFVDYSTSVPFVDLFKLSRPFYVHSDPQVEYDAQGWPIRLNGGVAQTYTMVELDRGGTDTIPLGEYTVLYDGNGTIQLSGLGQVISQVPGRITLNVSNLNGLLNIKITDIDESNPIKNIRILMPGGICINDPYHRVESAQACGVERYLPFETYHELIRYNPDFVRFLRHFSAVRYMDTMSTNGSNVENWSDMPAIDDATWSSYDRNTGAPIEILVDLANRLKVNPWFCMPHKATDTYITQFADYVKTHLDPQLTAYVEHSNEVWNGIFSQHGYARNKGIQQQLGGDAFQSALRYHAKRSVEIFEIWRNVFGDTSRFKRVLGGWAANTWSSMEMLDFNNTYTQVDALAIAPYFGGDFSGCGSPVTVDDIFTYLNDAGCEHSIPKARQYMVGQKSIVDSYGIELIAYEGGQHMVKWGAAASDPLAILLEAANLDTRISSSYLSYLNGWRDEGGGLFMHYSAPDRWDSRYGYWGIMQNLNQTRTEMPKFDSVLKFIDQN